MKIWMLLSFFIATTSVAAEPATGIRRFAFIAGANDGGGERPRLRYATSDAEAVARVLEELGGVLPTDRLVVLDPDRKGLDAGFDALKMRMQQAQGAHARVELIVYYSGHSDEHGLLLTGGERVPYSEFRGALEKLPADVRIAIVDSCASGAMTRKKGGTQRPPFLLDESAKVRGHAILTSSSEHEAAQESDRIRASFFTHFLLSGLRGAADVTADGRVTLNEAYQFAFAETLARTEKTQSGPQHAAYDIQLAGTGDLVMTDLRATSAGLVLPSDLAGRMFVRDDDERLVAELWKAQGRAVELGLAPGAYTITMETTEAVYAAALTLADGVRTPLQKSEFKRMKRELTAMRGDAGVELPSNLELPSGLDGASEKTYRYVPFSLGLIPELSTSHGDDVHKGFALSLIYGSAAKITGADLSLGGSWISDDLYGAQAAVGGVYTGGNVRGMQSAVGIAWAGGQLVGYQAAVGGSYIGGDLRGIQASVGANVVRGDAKGLQAAVGANLVAKDYLGMQMGVGFNFVPGVLRGAQVGAGLNLAHETHGLQLSLLNISGDVSGAQVGIVNIATGHAKGLQLGLVNYADELSGAPIGLVNIVRKGQLHPEIYTTTHEPLNVGFRFGSKYVYTLLTTGLMRKDLSPDESDDYYVGLGLGVHVPIRQAFADLDLSSLQRGFADVDNEILPRLRLSVGYSIREHLSIYGGAALNMFVGLNGHDDPDLAKNQFGVTPLLLDGKVALIEGDTTVRAWPSFHLGVRL